MGHHWAGELTDFHFDIKYRPERMNAAADTLLHYPIQLQEYSSEYAETVPTHVVAAIWQGGKWLKKTICHGLLHWFSTPDDSPATAEPFFTTEDMQTAQRHDSSINTVITLNKGGFIPHDKDKNFT